MWPTWEVMVFGTGQRNEFAVSRVSVRARLATDDGRRDVVGRRNSAALYRVSLPGPDAGLLLDELARTRRSSIDGGTFVLADGPVGATGQTMVHASIGATSVGATKSQAPDSGPNGPVTVVGERP